MMKCGKFGTFGRVSRVRDEDGRYYNGSVSRGSPERSLVLEGILQGISECNRDSMVLNVKNEDGSTRDVHVHGQILPDSIGHTIQVYNVTPVYYGRHGGRYFGDARVEIKDVELERTYNP